MPAFYIPALQAGFFPGSLAIQTSIEPAGIAQAVRRAIWSLDRDQPITDLATMDEILDGELLQRRIQTTLVGVFAGLALLLACVGLYGVLAQVVGRRIPEIGLRMALGAAPSGILRQVVGHGLKLTLIGVGIGIGGALAVSRLLATVLFEVKHTDPATYAVVAIVLLLTAAIASYLPARRAMRVDPIVALREE
jgi:ABC-type antimicrobial peptide transport system permease subunit